jgi:large subunit ribosomal protein L25
MSAQQHIKLAQSLPPRLIRFFQKFPPPALTPHVQTSVAPQAQTPVAPTSAPTEANAPAVEETPVTVSGLSPDAAELGYHNPFLPRKNFRTGKWIGPVYGLRKQADLVKLAQKHGVLDLLPYTIKKPGEKEKRRLERGLQVKGTGVGQKVKGKVWERTLKGRLEERRKAMENMPALIQEWKQVRLGKNDGVYLVTDSLAEGTRSRMEEVAQWQGSLSASRNLAALAEYGCKRVLLCGLEHIPCIFKACTNGLWASIFARSLGHRSKICFVSYQRNCISDLHLPCNTVLHYVLRVTSNKRAVMLSGVYNLGHQSCIQYPPARILSRNKGNESMQ